MDEKEIEDDMIQIIKWLTEARNSLYDMCYPSPNGLPSPPSLGADVRSPEMQAITRDCKYVLNTYKDILEKVDKHRHSIPNVMRGIKEYQKSGYYPVSPK